MLRIRRKILATNKRLQGAAPEYDWIEFRFIYEGFYTEDPLCEILVQQTVVPTLGYTSLHGPLPSFSLLYDSVQPCLETDYYDIRCDFSCFVTITKNETIFCKRPAMNPDYITLGKFHYIRVVTFSDNHSWPAR